MLKSACINLQSADPVLSKDFPALRCAEASLLYALASIMLYTYIISWQVTKVKLHLAKQMEPGLR